MYKQCWKKTDTLLFRWGFHNTGVRVLTVLQFWIFCLSLGGLFLGPWGQGIFAGCLLSSVNFFALGRLLQGLLEAGKIGTFLQLVSFYGRLLLTALALYGLLAFAHLPAWALLVGLSTVFFNILLWGMFRLLGKTSKEA